MTTIFVKYFAICGHDGAHRVSQILFHKTMRNSGKIVMRCVRAYK